LSLISSNILVLGCTCVARSHARHSKNVEALLDEVILIVPSSKKTMARLTSNHHADCGLAPILR
jgi:hypothetical protein